MYKWHELCMYCEKHFVYPVNSNTFLTCTRKIGFNIRVILSIYKKKGPVVKRPKLSQNIIETFWVICFQQSMHRLRVILFLGVKYVESRFLDCSQLSAISCLVV